MAEYTTLSYKRLPDGGEVLLDFYPPEVSGQAKLPAVVFLHGGGLVVGNRQTVFPIWLQSRLSRLGIAFFSADYRLLVPITGHDILEDVKDIFRFIKTNVFVYNGASYEIDPGRIVASGGSAGGLLASLAVVHCDAPKPKALFSLYGMGGSFLTPDYLQPKDKPNFRGRPLLDTKGLQNLLYPFPGTPIAPSSDVPYVQKPPPGTLPTPRSPLFQLYLQLGVFLDYYTGQHEPSLSAQLREALNEGKPSPDVGKLVPERHRVLFPHLLVDSSWPPTILVHGSADTAVSVDESRNLESLLKGAGVSVRYIEVEGKDHIFDGTPEAEDDCANVFDEVVEFLREALEG